VKILISLDLDEEFEDPLHETGVDEETFIAITTFLAGYGDDVGIEKAGTEAD
jgi:hypothetical protein